MSENNLEQKITELSQKIDDLESLISRLCELFADWTDNMVEQSNQPQPTDKKQPHPYIS
jgi:hypothetical protein